MNFHGVNVPCDCFAPVIMSGIDTDTGNVVISVYEITEIDGKENEKEIFTNYPEYADVDDLHVRCSRCGIDI